MNDGEWKRLFETSDRPAAMSPCPAPEVAATWASGPLPPYAVAHLAACAACREVLVVLRRPPAPERISPALRNLLPGRRPRTLYGVAAAAAVVLVALALALFRAPEPAPVRVVVTPPKPKVEVEAAPPAPPAPAPIPAVPPPTPRPDPLPEKAPPPPPTPVVPAPAPAPEIPAPTIPAPEKPAAPEPTRATLKATLLSIAGTASTQSEGEAALPLKPGQKREFPGIVHVKADNAVKFAIGTTTYYLQRGSELAIQLQEGRTHVQLARGEAFFDVTPGHGLFEVDGAAGKVVVKGTRFLVSETDVLVQRGAVEHTTGGQTSTLTPKAKVDLSRRLAWVRGLEDSLWIEAEQMTLQGGMAALADATASGGRAIGLTKPSGEATAEIRGKRKQAVPYAVWVRLLWPHNVPSALGLSVGDLRWTSKDVASAPAWQWVRAGTAELAEEAFRLRLSDTKIGLKVDQVLITSDLDFNPETDKR